MKIGFDAKRAFFNVSGLGNYSRNLLRALRSYYPENEYILYTPSKSGHLFSDAAGKFIIKEPEGFINRSFKSYWRSFSLARVLKRDKPDIFHGLSHELPCNIHKSGIKTVVTIHDLIFLRYPHLYKAADRIIYRRKFRYACQVADLVIAVSRQTANDIRQFFGTEESRIKVIYQSCNPVFRKELNKGEREETRKKYGFPESYILYVGTIEERKNLLTLLKAMDVGKIKLPLVAIGSKTSYYRTVKKYIDQNEKREIYFLESIANEDLPAIYQGAQVFVYPSIFEGFGIPVIEALYSKTPVITSGHGCFPEAGGPSSLYVDSLDAGQLADAISRVVEDRELREKMIGDGFDYVQRFNDNSLAAGIINAYKNLVKSG
jgi:glycosyltransferase involved in cell wall biosynthesis